MPPSIAIRRPALNLTLAAAAWGTGTVVSKGALDEIPPLALLPIQLTASLAALAVLARWQRLPFRNRSAAPVLGRLGLLNPGLAYALSLLGLVHITASLSVLLWATEPLMILILAAWVLREPLRPSLVALSIVAVAGMLLVIGRPAGAGPIVGIGLTLAGVACCAVYTIVARSSLTGAGAGLESTIQVVLVQQLHALAFALALALVAGLLGTGIHPVRLTAAGLLSAVASGILYYGLAYWFYLAGLRNAPASLAASSFYLIPVFGVVAGFLLLGERLEPRQWAGAATVLLAVGMLLLRTTSTRDHDDNAFATRPGRVADG